MFELNQLPRRGRATMDKQGNIEEQSSYICHNCGMGILDGEDIYSDEYGEDICLECYEQHVEPLEVWSEDGQEVIGYKEVA